MTFPYRRVSTTYLTLTIREVGLEDDGWYTCAASTRMDKAKHKVSTFLLHYSTLSFQRARLDVKKKTTMLVHPEPVSAVIGGTVTLACTISMDSSLVEDGEFYWTREGQGTYEERTLVQVIGHERQLVEHKIDGVVPSDQGHYRCHARTSFDDVASEAAVLEIKRGTEITQHPEDWEAEVGEEAEFLCSASTDPSLTSSLQFVWMRNGSPLVEGPDISTTERGARIVLHNLKREDSGQIQCRAKTFADSVTSNTAMLNVVLPTRIIEDPKGNQREVIEGTAVTLQCMAETDPSVADSIRLIWERSGVAVAAEDPRLSGDASSQLQLQLDGRMEDSGSYRCVATTSRDEARSAVVDVAIRAATAVQGPSSESLKLEGDTLWLECQVKVDPALKESVSVKWTRSGEVVSESEALVLEAASLEDSGDYSCEATTRLDSATSPPARVAIYPQSRIIGEPQSQRLLAGVPHSLHCGAKVAKGLAARGLVWTWEREGEKVAEEQGTALTTSLKLERGGSYSCSLRTKLETLAGSPAIITLVAPTLIMAPPQPLEAAQGQTLELQCGAVVDPRLPGGGTITWLKDGVLISSR